MSKIWVSIQVLPLAITGPANSLWQPTASTPNKSFLLFLAPTTTVSELFHHVDERYKRDYLKQSRHNSFYIKKLQDEDGDDLATDFSIGDLPRNAKDKLIIRVVPATVDRDFSVPEDSSLRPRDFARPKRVADYSYDAPQKRLRRDDSYFNTPSIIYHPDHPLRSTERDLADTHSAGPGRSSQPLHRPSHGHYGDVVGDSEDDRLAQHADDEQDEEDEEDEARESIPALSHVSAIPERSSPEGNGIFKKPALPGSINKKVESAQRRKYSNPVSLSNSISGAPLDEQWRHAQPRQNQPEVDDDPYVVPDTDNEQVLEASAELGDRRSGSIMSRHRNIEHLKNRRRSRGETSDLEKSPQPKSAKSDRRTNKTYGSARSKRMSSASRLAFADSQSQHGTPGPQQSTPDLDGFEKLLTEPMVSREELARRRSREEKAESVSRGEAARHYFITASAEKAKKHADSMSLPPTTTTTSSDAGSDASPTPASRLLPTKPSSERRTSSVSFVTPNDATKTQVTAPDRSATGSGDRGHLHPLFSSSAQPKTVAGPSSTITNNKRSSPLATPALRKRRSATMTAPNTYKLNTKIVDMRGPSSSTKLAAACTRCKTIKMSCTATKNGRYPCERCIRSPSHPKCEPPDGAGTPAPSSMKRTLSTSRKQKGKAPQPRPRAGTLENMRIDPEASIEPGNVSESEEEPTPAQRRGTNGAQKAKSSTLSGHTKKSATDTTLQPLTESLTKLSASSFPSKPVNGIENNRPASHEGPPLALAEAFRTPSPDDTVKPTQNIIDDKAISQEDESSGSEGDVESNVPEDPIPVETNGIHTLDEAGASVASKQGDSGTDEEDEEDEDDEDDDDEEDDDDNDDDDVKDDSFSSSSVPSSSSNGEQPSESQKKAPAQEASSSAKTPTPPQSFPFASSQASHQAESPESSASRVRTSPPTATKLPSPPSKNTKSGATTAINPSTKKEGKGSDSDSDSSSSSSSSSSSVESSSDGGPTADQKRYAGQGGLVPSSSGTARGGRRNSRFGSVKSFISSTFGFSSSQHNSGGRNEWYNVPDSPEPELEL